MGKHALTVFPYYKNPDGAYFPIIPLQLRSQKKNLDSSALIDSGATISIFRTDVAEYLGIPIQKGKEIFLGGVGGRIKGYIHTLEMKIANEAFHCPIVFSFEYLVSFNLLGRNAFFKKYTIMFEERRKRITLQ